ncbi:MAG TPA: hypothetical protein VIU46_02200 [Gallionellaceae bacterium]
MRLAILLFTWLMVVHAAVFAAEPAAESDAQKAVRYTAALETNPFASDAKQMRQWMMAWVTDTPDYTVYVCGDLFGPMMKKKHEDVPYGPELLMQQMFGNVAYQIGNPGTHDEVSKQLAGMESLLKVYALVVARDAKARMPYYDNLLAEQKKGSLKAYLTPIIEKKCAKKP